jgi:hypothetical protein
MSPVTVAGTSSAMVVQLSITAFRGQLLIRVVQTALSNVSITAAA